MLNKIKTLNDYSIQNIDGETIGTVKEFYFDDQHWTIRYLVVHTGTWLTGRQVIISPYAIISINDYDHTIVVNLTKTQIENSPALASDMPVSRQYEETYYEYYGLPVYWNGPFTWGYYPYIERDSGNWTHVAASEKKQDHHLRSSREVTGYYVQAEDGDLGHIYDFIVDERAWTIRYLIIDTTNWWLGKKVLISPQWITKVSYEESKIFINLTRETIKQAPEFTDKSMLDREYEYGLYGHYNRKGYWTE
jgi:sporulation protein YlmC with PRC-barrel domain